MVSLVLVNIIDINLVVGVICHDCIFVMSYLEYTLFSKDNVINSKLMHTFYAILIRVLA